MMNLTPVNCAAGSAYLYEAPEIPPVFGGVRNAYSLV